MSELEILRRIVQLEWLYGKRTPTEIAEAYEWSARDDPDDPINPSLQSKRLLLAKAFRELAKC